MIETVQYQYPSLRYLNGTSPSPEKRRRRPRWNKRAHHQSDSDESSFAIEKDGKKAVPLGGSDVSKAKVHFPENADELVQQIPRSFKKISDEEARKIWYTEYDYDRFEKDRVLTAMQYLQSRKIGFSGPRFDERRQTTRGLEAYVDENLRKRQETERLELLRSMRSEQEVQQKTGTYPDLPKFHSVSEKATKAARARAQMAGIADAKASRSKPSYLGRFRRHK